jgi:trigger factor
MPASPGRFPAQTRRLSRGGEQKGLLVNVTIENLAPCKKLVRVEVEPEKVEEAFEIATRDVAKSVSLPGFRPGKAPRDLVARRFESTIEEEVKRRLIPDAYRKALADHHLSPVGSPHIEEIQFGRGQPLQFAATVETAPDFELPEYKGIPVKVEARTVTDEDVSKAIDMLRHRVAEYVTVDRPLQEGDLAVVNYTGTTEGRPITEVAPASRGIAQQQNFWIEMRPEAFIPGFSIPLLGARAGETRKVQLQFPADFVTPQLAGKPGEYEVQIVEVKEKRLPELNEEFARSYGAESLERLQAGVRHDLEKELEHKMETEIRKQLVKALMDRTTFDLPEGMVVSETRNVIYDIVRENQKRGVDPDSIQKEKEAIYNVASSTAKDRVKLNFVLEKIAEKESIQATQEEIQRRIYFHAQMADIPLGKFVKELQKRDGVYEIADQIRKEKTLEFLKKHAAMEPAAEAAAPAS